MGYGYIVNDVKVRVSAEKVPSLMDALEEFVVAKYLRQGELPDHKLSHETIMENLSWVYSFSDGGDITEVWRRLTKDLREKELEIIAPYVDEGSYIEISDESGVLFRFVFREGGMRKVYADISYPE